jgi:dolichol-phosphate mannosyltransferase
VCRRLADIRCREVETIGEANDVNMAMLENRAVQALRKPANWLQLGKFGVVGGSGYVVNLGVYTILLKGFDVHYLGAATVSFVVAASWNYWWNRHWTFREQRGHFAYQGMRFFAVSGMVYIANLGVLSLLVSLGAGKVIAQAVAIVVVTPLNFLGNKLWSFRR